MNKLVSVTASARAGWSRITVEIAYAESLRGYLRRMHLTMVGVQGAVILNRDLFEVQATPQSLERVIGEWLEQLD